MEIEWPFTVDDILDGDQTVVLAHVTPAGGNVLTPLTNFAVREDEPGKITPLSSSVGMWKKLERLEKNPRVAVAYHTRHHSFSKRPEYVLVQGHAELSPREDESWLESHRENWGRFAGQRDVGRLWERWMRIYHWRVGITLTVERLVVWPDLTCQDDPAVYGPALPNDAPSQNDPKRGTSPRVDHRRAAERLRELPHVLLGWVAGDGFPIVVPVQVLTTEADGIVLALPAGVEYSGARRAGLVGHTFARFNYGQNQRRYTGWLEARAEPRQVIYAPHTEAGYRLPASKLLYRISAGAVTRRGFREARRAGFLSG